MQIDKQAHFWAGAAIAATTTLYLSNPVFGVLACLLFAALKEFVDYLGFGTPDVDDFLATLLGSVVLLPMFVI